MVVGFEGLLRRLETQRKFIQSIESQASVLVDSAKKLKGTIQANTLQLRACGVKQQELEQRMIRTFARLELLRSRNLSMLGGEIDLAQRALRLSQEINGPSYPAVCS